MINTLMIKEGINGITVTEMVFLNRQEAIDMVTFEILGDLEYKVLTDNPKMFAVCYQEQPNTLKSSIVLHFHVDFITYDAQDEHKAAIITVSADDSTVDIISVKNPKNIKKLVRNTAKQLSQDAKKIFEDSDIIIYCCQDDIGQAVTITACTNFVEEE